jgi:serine phosphatase RsbU (regulator of sigma subunit)
VKTAVDTNVFIALFSGDADASAAAQAALEEAQASLPKEVPSLQGWQISPYYHPAREVGGDFYDFHLLSEDRLGVVVGDATGKRVPAALVMASARSMLRALAQASNSPGEVLRRVNDALVTDIPPQHVRHLLLRYRRST